MTGYTANVPLIPGKKTSVKRPPAPKQALRMNTHNKHLTPKDDGIALAMAENPGTQGSR